MVSKDRAGEADKQDWFVNENLQNQGTFSVAETKYNSNNITVFLIHLILNLHHVFFPLLWQLFTVSLPWQFLSFIFLQNFQ